jgi:hypothetical protein
MAIAQRTWHGNFDADTNERLQRLYDEWVTADNYATEFGYEQKTLCYDENKKPYFVSRNTAIEEAERAYQAYMTARQQAITERDGAK